MGKILRRAPKFPLIPEYMSALVLPIALQWEQIPFKEDNVDLVIEGPGIYAFAVAHRQAGLPPHGYVLYIGEAGAKKGPARTLRARFKEYLREKHKGKRPHVAVFLNTWETCLTFHLVSMDPKAVDMLDIERRLNDAMLPPFSRCDLSPQISFS